MVRDFKTFFKGVAKLPLSIVVPLSDEEVGPQRKISKEEVQKSQDSTDAAEYQLNELKEKERLLKEQEERLNEQLLHAQYDAEEANTALDKEKKSFLKRKLSKKRNEAQRQAAELSNIEAALEKQKTMLQEAKAQITQAQQTLNEQREESEDVLFLWNKEQARFWHKKRKPRFRENSVKL